MPGRPGTARIPRERTRPGHNRFMGLPRGVRVGITAALLMLGCSRAPAPEAAPAGTPPAPSAPPPPSRDLAAFTAAVDALAAEALEGGPVAGLSIAVVERGSPVLVKGYGHADREAGIPAAPSTSYPIASVTKNFTAGLILRLADQGRLGLEDPLSRFFPDARPSIGALTIRHLLEHTSGLTRGGPAPHAAALSVLRRGDTARGQGEDWDYSNYNYSLLGLVIEQVSGRSYSRYLHDEVVAPLGLAGTGYCEDGTVVPGRGRDYLSGGKSLSPTAYWSEARFYAGGGLCSTVEDLVAWVKALEDGRVISPAMLQAMRTPARLPGGLEAGYGYGTRLGFTGGHRKLGHTGGGQSNKAVLARYPDDDVTIAVLLNTERKDARVTASDIEEHVARLFFGVPELPAPAAPPPEDDLRRRAGRYLDGPRLVVLAAEDGTLRRRTGARRTGEGRLIPQGGDVFVDGEKPSVELRFQVDGDQVRGYGRYHHGWFVGVGVRTGDSAGAPAAPAPAANPSAQPDRGETRQRRSRRRSRGSAGVGPACGRRPCGAPFQTARTSSGPSGYSSVLAGSATAARSASSATRSAPSASVYSYR
jgi:D-alanyl-D-alanine carboxypeptidase